MAATRRSTVPLRLLEAARGISLPDGAVAKDRKPLRCFPLQSKHVGSLATVDRTLPTPVEFHTKLCDLIRGATKRVYLTSLYVGPAVGANDVKERELLDCIAAIPSHVSVKVLLDKNRALRPVPLPETTDTTAATAAVATTTSSAEAVYKSLNVRAANTENGTSQNQLRLFPVLPKFLPNPFDELAGVFHIKLYIIDDELIISGANLSEEYFLNRQDRYILFQEGGNGLVDCYAQLVDALCDYAHPYHEETAANTNNATTDERKPITKDELMQLIAKILSDEDADSSSLNDSDDTVAFAIPTFSPPPGFYTTSKVPFVSDVEATRSLLSAALADESDHVVRVATAYLNPTKDFVNVLSDFAGTQLLTAGRVSHGFAPKKKAGNKGKDWIPSVFDRLSTAAARDTKGKLLYWNKEDWTYHAKGLWLSTHESNQTSTITDPESLVAAVFGSGNFGSRSERLDMECNCLLILTEGSPLKTTFATEWNELCHFAEEQEHEQSDAERGYSLPLSVRVALPLIRDFF